MKNVHNEKNASDRLIWVDVYDNEIGSGEKMETHIGNHLHRAFSVFLVHDGKMLLQKRALWKYHSGGLWANTCCSHPRVGEATEAAVQKRMEEELGIPKGTCAPQELFHFNYFTQYEGLSEYEVDHVFVCDYDGEVSPDPEEIAELRWISFEELEKEMLNAPETFSSWFLIAAPRVLENLK